MKLTGALFCTWVLFGKKRCSVQRLVDRAAALNVDLRDYDIRRALRELTQRRLVEFVRSKHSAKLLYALTTKGRNDVRRDRKVLRSIHGTLELKLKKTPKLATKSIKKTPFGDAQGDVGMD